MNIILYQIPNMLRFMKAIEKCSGNVLLEMEDKRYLNLKDAEEGYFFMKHIGAKPCGLRLLIEENDAGRLISALQ